METINFHTTWNDKTEKLIMKDGTVQTDSGKKLYCERCRFPFRKEHTVTGEDGSIRLRHDENGHVYCPICANEEGITGK